MPHHIQKIDAISRPDFIGKPKHCYLVVNHMNQCVGKYNTELEALKAKDALNGIAVTKKEETKHAVPVEKSKRWSRRSK